MDKKELTSTLTMIGLSLLFAIVSALLFLSKGRSKFWTAKKIKIGAALITLSSFTQSCRPFVSCYDPAPPENNIYLLLENDTINLKDTIIINGGIENRVSNNFSYKLENNDSTQFKQVENLVASDGAFDEYSEEFTIDIDTTLRSGNYTLKLYDVSKEMQVNTQYPRIEYYINLINE